MRDISGLAHRKDCCRGFAKWSFVTGWRGRKRRGQGLHRLVPSLMGHELATYVADGSENPPVVRVRENQPGRRAGQASGVGVEGSSSHLTLRSREPVLAHHISSSEPVASSWRVSPTATSSRCLETGRKARPWMGELRPLSQHLWVGHLNVPATDHAPQAARVQDVGLNKVKGQAPGCAGVRGREGVQKVRVWGGAGHQD